MPTATPTATPPPTGVQLFDGSWVVKAFGNELTTGTGASAIYSAWAIPQGNLCNPQQPRCPFVSTPTDGKGNFAPLGGSRDQALHCAPWFDWYGGGATMRPAKGATPTTGGPNQRPIPPLYRNPFFFTAGGQPNTYSCTATSTDGFGGPGPVMIGNPVKGRWSATTTGTGKGGFQFGPAPATVPAGITMGIRVTGLTGEFGLIYPYFYRYTYATLRNDQGMFGPGGGPGSFNIQYKLGKSTVASINVKQGAAKFGGTMRMLGAITTKVCSYRLGGCSLGKNNWRYEAIGASAYTMDGVVTQGYQALYTEMYYHTALMSQRTVNVVGSRFPWTTGTVTVTAAGRGPHKTVHYAHGYDNRNTNTPLGLGTIQLVTPVLTRWLRPGSSFETGGIGILQIKFIPEPQTWAMLVAGVGALVVLRGASQRR